MPLTTARRGVFKGRQFKAWHWLVVDPSAEDPARVQQEWLAVAAKTNSLRPRAVFSLVAGWATFAIVVTGVIAGAFWLHGVLVAANVAVPTLIVGWAAFLGIIATVLLGIWVVNALAPVVGLEPNPNVLEVPDSVERWALDTVPHEELWALTYRYDRVIQLVNFQVTSIDTWPIVQPWFTPQVEGLLDEHYATEMSALELLAARLNFPIPNELRQIPRILR